MKTQFGTLLKTMSVICTILLSVTFVSCSNSDDDSNGNYSISFKANGTPKHFTSQQVEEGLYIDNFTPYRLTFSAYSDTETIFITLYDMLSLTERNYNGYTVTQTDTNVIISGPTIGYQTNNLNYSTVLDSNYPDVALELTEITSNTMKGRFSGILKRNGTPDIVITEGEFVIPYKTNPN